MRVPAGLCLAVCRNYLREFEAALLASGADGVALVSYPAHCGRPVLDWPTLATVFGESGTAGGQRCVIGGGCLMRLGEPPPGPLRDCQALREEHCFNLIAGRTLVGHLLREREHLLCPGWLEHWREYAQGWGLDQATAGQLFRETTSQLTLLDTGVIPGADELLHEFARFTARPCRVLPVGLDHLGLVVDRVVDRWRERSRRTEATAAIARVGRESADYQMVFDLVGTLAEVKGEVETVGRVLDLFSLLFAPRSLVLAQIGAGEVLRVEARPPGAATDLAAVRRLSSRGSGQAEAFGEAGFRVPIGHRGETLGIVVVDQVRFPEHLDHYRRVAETVARVCGLALANAGAYQELQATVAELTAARDSVRTLAGLIPICAHCKQIRDDTGYWHSVEKYVQDHSSATLTHGICPACAEKYFPGLGLGKRPGAAAGGL